MHARIPRKSSRRTSHPKPTPLVDDPPRRGRRLTLRVNKASKEGKVSTKATDKKKAPKGKQNSFAIHFISIKIFKLTILSSCYFLDNNDNIGDMLAAITLHETNFKPTDDSLLASHALPHNICHQYLINVVTQDFLTALHVFNLFLTSLPAAKK